MWVSAPEPMRAAMTDDTPLESSPPESDTPTGTSAIMWRRITRSNSSPKRPAYSASLSEEENSGLTSGDQYFVVLVLPSAVTVMKWPGNSRFTPAKNVSLPAVVHTVQKEPVEHRDVGRPFETRVLEEGLQLRGETEAAGRLVVIERLYPEPVPGEVHHMGAGIDDREGEHPHEVGHARAAPLLVGAQHGLGVGVVRDESMPRPFQLGTKLGVVVELPVEHDEGPGAFGTDRLLAPDEVDDGQSPHPDGEFLSIRGSGGIGPTVLDRGQHRLEQLRSRGR